MEGPEQTDQRDSQSQKEPSSVFDRVFDRQQKPRKANHLVGQGIPATTHGHVGGKSEQQRTQEAGRKLEAPHAEKRKKQ